MKYLLYCICQQGVDEFPPEFPSESPQEFPPAPGIRVVKADDLAAVVSEAEELAAAPSVYSLWAFARVVEAVHARQTVIPLRYGCLMESEEQIVRLLEDRRDEYKALLHQLRGMTEMGIRLLLPANAAPLRNVPESPGAAYLASLRNRYNVQDTLAPEETELADRVAGLLAQWSIGQRREISSSGQGRMLSLYFLIPRSHSEEFRQRAREISTPPGVKLLLSGPWPPYNFVAVS
jgi:hypothetical protein